MLDQKKVFVLTGLALVGVFFAGAYFYKNFESSKIADVIEEDSGALVREYSPSIGSPMLRVTLVEFLDPECESCRFFHPIVKGLLKKYEGKMRYVVRYAPFHGNSKQAIAILEAARRQNKYWETLDLLFEKLPEWGSHHNPRPDLMWTYLPQLELDIDQMKKDVQDEAIGLMIEQEVKDGTKLRVRYTPTFFLNGERLDFQKPEDLDTAVENAIQ